MAISSYTDLQSAVARWLTRGDLTSRVPDFISLAEANFNRVLRVRQMEVRDTATVASGVEYGSVPTDWLETKTFSFTDGTHTWWLEPKPDAVIDEARDRTGRPRFYAEVGGEFRFYPSPDATYTAQLTYYGQIQALSDANPSNWLLSAAPDAYLAGALVEAAPMLRDNDALQIWTVKRDAALAAIQTASRTKAGRLRTDFPVSIIGRRGGFSMLNG